MTRKKDTGKDQRVKDITSLIHKKLNHDKNASPGAIIATAVIGAIALGGMFLYNYWQNHRRAKKKETEPDDNASDNVIP